MIILSFSFTYKVFKYSSENIVFLIITVIEEPSNLKSGSGRSHSLHHSIILLVPDPNSSIYLSKKKILAIKGL